MTKDEQILADVRALVQDVIENKAGRPNLIIFEGKEYLLQPNGNYLCEGEIEKLHIVGTIEV